MSSAHDPLHHELASTFETAADALAFLTDDELEAAYIALDARASRERREGDGYQIVAGLDLPTNEAVRLIEGERYARWLKRTLVCQDCVRGTWTREDGSAWRCHACGGSGRVSKDA